MISQARRNAAFEELVKMAVESWWRASQWERPQLWYIPHGHNVCASAEPPGEPWTLAHAESMGRHWTHAQARRWIADVLARLPVFSPDVDEP